MSEAFENEILKSLDRLTKEQQSKVLAFVKSLLRSREAKSDLLQFAGTLDVVSIREMNDAIEADCENVDSNEW